MVLDFTEEESTKTCIAKIKELEQRLEKLKDFIVKYLTMGNEFALGSLKAALKNV